MVNNLHVHLYTSKYGWCLILGPVWIYFCQKLLLFNVISVASNGLKAEVHYCVLRNRLLIGFVFCLKNIEYHQPYRLNLCGLLKFTALKFNLYCYIQGCPVDRMELGWSRVAPELWKGQQDSVLESKHRRGKSVPIMPSYWLFSGEFTEESHFCHL